MGLPFDFLRLRVSETLSASQLGANYSIQFTEAKITFLLEIKKRAQTLHKSFISGS